MELKRAQCDVEHGDAEHRRVKERLARGWKTGGGRLSERGIMHH